VTGVLDLLTLATNHRRVPGRKWATQQEAAQDSVTKFLSFVPFPILYRKSNHSRGNSFDTLMYLLFHLLSGSKLPNHDWICLGGDIQSLQAQCSSDFAGCERSPPSDAPQVRSDETLPNA